MLRAARLRGSEPRGRAWEDAARSNVAAALRTQRDDGALPAAHRVESGEAASWEGTAGIAWIPIMQLIGGGHRSSFFTASGIAKSGGSKQRKTK